MMRPIDSRVMDINSEAMGVKVADLMENAGTALSEVITDMFPESRVLFICGPGNNGGDGFVAARMLKADVMVLSEPRSPLAKEMASKVRYGKFDPSKLDEYDIIVDCALGTGIKGEMKPPYDGYVDAVNSFEGIVISCDVPSGLGTDKCVIPDVTVTFHDMKEGMNVDNSGTIFIMDIGIPEDAYDIIGKGDMIRYPIPEDGSHKGQNGRLLVIGGGPYYGAPAMASLAALRVGTDLIHIVTPSSSYQSICNASPAFIVHQLPGDILSERSVSTLLKLSKDVDAVLIGPGLGKDERTVEAVRSFVERCDKPLVIDADGITAMSGSNIVKDTPVVYTPHHAEFSRLTRFKDVSKAAKKLSAVIVLKGPEDLISDGDRIRRNITGTPAMTVGGRGDVLAGTVAGLLAKGMSAFDAGCLGAYICGKAGELSYDEFSYGMLPTDIIDNIGRVLRSELR